MSGVGDDANPCSRPVPCKTWAGAISKTAPGGEIDALDPGGGVLSRRGRVYGSGVGTLGAHGQTAPMKLTRRVPAGRCTLTLWRGNRRVASAFVLIR